MQARLKRRSFPAGAAIIQEDRPPSGLYVVLGGSIRLTASVTDAANSLAVLKEGDHSGAVALIDGLAQSATVVAEEPVETMSISGTDLHRIPARDPGLARRRDA